MKVLERLPWYSWMILLSGYIIGRTSGLSWQQDVCTQLTANGLSEGTGVGNLIGTLLVQQQPLQVFYGTTSPLLAVNEVSGAVTLGLKVDREVTPIVNFTFTARDSSSTQIETSCSVNVNDINDNPPVFQNTPYTVSVPENAAISDLIPNQIFVSDADIGVNAQMNLFCFVPAGNNLATLACDAFDIVGQMNSDGSMQATLSVKAPLDYETTSTYIMTVRAEDQGSPARTSQTNIEIRISDVQDKPPAFLTSQLSLSVRENAALDTVLMPPIEVYDQDIAVPRPLVIRIAPDPNNLFKLGNSSINTQNVYSVNVLTNGAIKREMLGNSYGLVVEAVELNQDGQETSAMATMPVTVTIIDVNDNTPMFNAPVYQISMPEELSDGTDISGLNMIVNDPDVGDNAFFELSVINDSSNSLPVPMSSIYKVSPTNGTGSASIVLVLTDNRYADYEEPLYRMQYLQILARETKSVEGLSSTAVVVISLTDQNDNLPQFSANQYTSAVRENTQVGMTITTITASDADSGVYGQVTYSLSGGGSDVFAVDNATGTVTLQKSLDFETQKVYVLQFQATDGGGRAKNVPFRINVLDFNDEGPVFSRVQYEAILLETLVALQPALTVTATDADSDFLVTYSIIGGNTPDNAFTINNFTGEVLVKRPIDFNETPNRQGFFELLIEGSDNGRVPQTSRVLAIITVRDLNDNTPVFSQPIYYATVPELVDLNMTVTTVSASDMDTGRNSLITFQISKGHKDNFVIDAQSGVISPAITNLDIDRYTDKYSIVVHAVDGGSPQRTGVAQVMITVTDSNNQMPMFSQSTYVVTVQEEAPLRTVVGTFPATDSDDTSSLYYAIRPGSITARDKTGNAVTSTARFDFKSAFEINVNTGAVYTVLTLNRNEVAQVTLLIEVNDTNAELPAIQLGVATVQINILSALDAGISFPPPWTAENPEFVITVQDGTAKDSMITQITATDPETGNPITDYREVSGSDPMDYFTVEQPTGRILANQLLDYETLPIKTLSLQLQAFSSPPDPQSAVATIKVIVEDVNDNSPVFQQNSYSYSIPEDFVYPGALGLPVLATDADSGNFSTIVYSLSGQDSQLFIIDPITGVVEVAPNVTLDREIKSEYTFFITATDNVGGAGEQRTVSVIMTITLNDINDKVPQFEQTEYNLYTLETVEADTSLGQVTARDDDADSNGQVDYSIESSNDPGLFFIETSTGILRCNVPLSGHAQELPYELTVRAQDRGSVPLMSQVKVNIFVNDQQSSDGTPRILFPTEDGMTFTVPEGSNIGDNITQIIAQNRNPQSGSTIMYSFLANDAINPDSSKFNIDPATGVITIKGDLDYESKRIYELIIVIRTNTEPPREVQQRIYVNLTDVNDNIPSFNCPPLPFTDPLLASVSENVADVEFIQVLACDADGPGNNVIYFFITCGNSADPYYNGSAPFKINATSGVISTKTSLDREHLHSYEICVEVSNSPDYQGNNEGGRKKRQLITNKVIRVQITITDVDDNGPSFGDKDAQTGSKYIAGVLATAKLGTTLIQIQATDGDNNPNVARITYSLDTEEFNHPDNRNQRTPLAFRIDPTTGVVTTNLNSYIDYIDGYFYMKVVSTDSQNRIAEANLYIYVVREFQRLRFIFGSEPNEVKTYYIHFLDQVRNFFSEVYQINSDSMRYHIKEGAEVDFLKTDLCFHIVRDNRVVNADVALDIFKDKYNAESELQDLYSAYTVEGVDICEVKTTTKWWSGYWWLWWLLIALALFILLVSLIMICCICVCWPKYKRNSYKQRPYVMLDPPMSMPDYEWQEEVVVME